MKKLVTAQIEFFPYRELGMEVVRGKDVLRPFGRHAHTSFCIGLIQESTRMLTCREQVYRVKPGQLFLLPPDTAHAIDNLDRLPASYLMLVIYPETLGKLTGNQAIVPEKFVLDSPLLYKEFVELHEMLLQDGPVPDKKAVLWQSISALLARCATIKDRPLADCRHRDVVAKVKEHLETYYTGSFSLTELAELVHLSPYHLIRVFTEYTGLPPHMYRQQLRIRHAKRMLSAGANIAAAAMATGFYDQSHFARVFKQLVGTTPGAYCRQVTAWHQPHR